MIITNIAKTILSSAGDYWNPADHDKYIQIDAVKFDKNEAYRLRGPFNKRYGLIYIEKSDETRTFDEILADTIEEAKYSIGTFPWKYQEKLEEFFGNGVWFYWNDTTKTSISSIDVDAGADWSGYKKTGARCSLFAATNRGRGRLLSPLTTKEIEDAHSYSIEKRCKWITDSIRSLTCKERLYRVRLQGNDDCSWGASFNTLNECYLLVQELNKHGFAVVDARMDYTN
jgi:hypothetical protein